MKWIAALILVAACSGKSRDEPPGELPSGDTVGAAPPIDASTAPVNSTAAEKEFWKRADAACPDGGKLAGAGSRNVYCAGSSGEMHGPAATFGEKGELLELTMFSRGKRDGLTTTWSPQGVKLHESTMRQNNQHGTSTRYHTNGQKAYQGTWRDGRPDGTFRAWNEQGVELGSFAMKNGTGTLIEWHDSGQKAWEQPMVNGQAHGTIVHWHPNGAKSSESTFARGAAVGPTTSWDDKGRLVMKGQYKSDQQEGDWTYRDPATGQITRVDRYAGGRQVASIDYQDGKPLGKPGSTACTGDDAVAAAYHKQTGKQLDVEHRCIHHALHFPGVALVGGFAHDRGCAQVAALIDCKVVESLEPVALLARAGWGSARGAAREKMAMSYLREVHMAWGGHMGEEPEPPRVAQDKDGGVTVTAWIAEPSGMTQEITRHLTEFRFAANGALASRVVRTERTR